MRQVAAWNREQQGKRCDCALYTIKLLLHDLVIHPFGSPLLSYDTQNCITAVVVNHEKGCRLTQRAARWAMTLCPIQHQTVVCLFTHIQHIVRTYDSRQSCLWSAEQGDQMKIIMRHTHKYTKPLPADLTCSTFQSAAADGGRSISHRKRQNKDKKQTKSKQVAVMSVHTRWV